MRLRILVGLLLLDSVVLAQTPAEIAARAELLRQAQEAQQRGDHAAALSFAERGAAIQMTPSVRLFLAEELAAMHRYADSMGSALLCVRETERDPSVANRNVILERCRALVARLRSESATLTVQPPSPLPAGLVVRINGEVLPAALYGLPYTVRPGELVVEAVAPEHGAFRRVLQMSAGDGSSVTLELAANTVSPVVPVVPPPRPRLQLAGPLTLFGVAAVTAGVSVGLFVSRNAEFSVLQQRAGCGGQEPLYCPDTTANQASRSSIVTLTWASNALWITSVASALGGGGWLLAQMLAPRPRSTTFLLPTSSGVALQGSF